MPISSQPEFLPPAGQDLAHDLAHDLKPRLKLGPELFGNENLDLLSHLLDDWFRVPGTSIRFGIDGIIGLIPGLGDVLTGLASCIIVFAAWLRGVPYITLARMIVNLGIDVVIGAIPFLGDAFDIAWKANRRNYALLTRHVQQPHRHTWRDWAFLLLLGSLLAAIFMAPAIMLVVLVEWLYHTSSTLAWHPR